MTQKGDNSRPFRLVGQLGGGGAEVPSHWPVCPEYLAASYRLRFYGICRRLEEHGMLSNADVGDIEALAIAEDNLEQATILVTANGKYATVIKQGRPYQCPACKGSGVRPMPKGHGERVTAAVTAPPLQKATGRQCSICPHPNRGEIDAALGRGESFGSVSKRYGVSKAAAFRHKREHLGKPTRPVLIDAADPTCLGCSGKGVIIPEMRESSEKRPEVTDQRYAIEQVASLSAKMGLDVTSRVRVKGKVKEAPGGPSALRELLSRRATR